MIDLDAIKTQFGRNLDSILPAELAQILQDQELKNVPAIPSWQGFTTLIEASLLQNKTLLLDAGANMQHLEISVADFQSIIKVDCIGNLSVRPPQLPSSNEMDQEQIFHAVKSFTQLRIKKRLEETLEMPPLPTTAQRIIKLRADPDADISDLSAIVELDPSLAAQVVSWASSPYYSAPGKIKSVHDAIIRVLGFDMVLNLALGLALGKTMNTKSMTTAQISHYWYSAVCTAAAVEGLVTSIPREHRPGFGMAYLSGLLNNFGLLILSEVFPPYFSNLNRHYSANSHMPQALVEQQLIGVSSCQMTAWLMKVWNMPEEVITAIRYQNDPRFKGEHCVYAKLNYLAKQLLANAGTGLGAYQEIEKEVFESLHIDPETAKMAIENILKSADDLKAISEQIQG
jgi:HD-like signal output (HDOD) protein